MNDCAFLFPGQGAQYVGMGQELAERFPECREILDRAEAHLHLLLRETMFFGPEERLYEDFIAQVAVYVVSSMIADLLHAKGVKARALAPYSSGIYAAAYASGAIDFETGLRLMSEAYSCIRSQNSRGAMGVVLGLSTEEVAQLCEKVDGIVEVSIVNTRHQTIVSGEPRAVEDLLKRAGKAGALKTDWLPVSEAYHCSLLRDSDRCLAKTISETAVGKPRIPIISYIDLQPLESASQVAALLSMQLRSTVKWVGVVEELLRRKMTPLVEIGPGRMLCRSVRWIHRQAVVLNTENVDALERALENLGGCR